MVALDSTWARIGGVTGLLVAVAVGFVALANLLTDAEAEPPRAEGSRLR
jgi:succinate-acetate transporter protein